MTRDAQILVRLTKDEKKRINQAAAVSGEAASVWMRQTLRAGADAALDGLNTESETEISPAKNGLEQMDRREKVPSQTVPTEPEISPLDLPDAEVSES